jgi:ABC-type multidrug transport system fused ATPase/permease subunit
VAVVCATLYTFLPRRPDVYRDGKIVDQQYTVSLFGRLTYAWADPLLRFTVGNRGLEIDNLPSLDNATRSVNLRARLENVKGSLALWKALIVAYWWPFTVQLVIIVIQSVLQFAPQVALFGILQTLEARAHGSGSGSSWVAFFWVMTLGVFMILSSSIEAFLFWTVWANIAIPMQEQLAAVVFAKSMRRKAVKSAKKTKETITVPAQDANLPQALVNASKTEDGEEGDDIQKSNQTIVNLIAVDARRICDAAAFNYLLPGSLLKLVIAISFLASLLGWPSTLAGLSVSVVITPANVYLAKRFTNAQNDLMKSRDQKVAAVTEVLQGIRQIKFSALEAPWQDKVMAIRETELTAIWRVFMYDVGLITIWILGPLMLSAVSLAVYVILNNGLTASVAFTAIAIFSSLEMSLAIIPELLSQYLEGWVSAGRIDKYLGLAEKIENTIPADHIAFESASVAWPADDDTAEEDRFVLRNLNLKFPPKALSVVSGKTGSGKSLLLAAILGECDVLGGTLKAPRPPPLEERFDDTANDGNWLIDSAIAFVSQTPWIENATLKDNILFGLPYNDARYDQVLYACALKKDFEMLPDGELTDIGANGINLSGGQKWRVSFARALYSRAGILIMDDIFSAVDAHTGRHLYEKALTGPICNGRTRILVTHHVGLCLPRTDYSVFLEDGTARYAGTVEELRQSNKLSSILAQDAEEGGSTDSEVLESNESTTDESSDSDGAVLKKILSNRSRRDSVIDGQDKPKQAPKKFVEEEKREVGRVKTSVYKRFFKAGGSIPFWVAVFLSFTSYTILLLGRVSYLFSAHIRLECV